MICRVLVTGARAPVALDCARAFAAAGHSVHLADSVTPWAARWSRLDAPVHRLPPPRHDFGGFREALDALVGREAIDLVVPTCEEVFYIAAASPPAELFAPPLATLRRLHSKIDFAALGTGIGLDMPETIAIEDRAALASLPLGDMVLKPEFSRFAAATLVRPSAARAAAIKPSAGQRWAAQRFVAGEEICLWSAAYRGRITALAAYRPRWRHGRSAAYAFEAIDVPAAARIAHSVAEATGITGHLSFDIILTPDGRAMPIECNPRAVSGLHLFDAGADLADAISGRPIAGPPPGRLRYLSPAMAMLGLPAAIAGGRVGHLYEDWRRGADAIGRAGDPWPIAGTLIDAARFAVIGLSRRHSPTGQTTDDIEWNGEPIG